MISLSFLEVFLAIAESGLAPLRCARFFDFFMIFYDFCSILMDFGSLGASILVVLEGPGAPGSLLRERSNIKILFFSYFFPRFRS